MRMTLFTSNIYEYLKEDNVIDYGNNAVTQLADRLFQQTDNEIEYIKTPKPVVVSEIVEIAKKFSTEKSSKFINGVLAKV